MKILTSFPNPVAAQIFAAYLDSCGVASKVLNANMGAIAPWQLGTNGVDVAVEEEDLPQAQELLKEFENGTIVEEP